MLITVTAPKGGQGASVTTAALALVAARNVTECTVTVADLTGDQPAVFGLAADPPTGLADWLAAGPDAPVDALHRLRVEATPTVGLLPLGDRRPWDEVTPAADAARAGADLALAVRDSGLVVADVGTRTDPAARALVEAADERVAVVRGDYLALRRAMAHPSVTRSRIALMDLDGASLDAAVVRDVLDRPVVARVPVRANIARAVDAGVLAARLPDRLARYAAQILDALGVITVEAAA